MMGNKICKHGDCSDKVYGHGYCNNHYRKFIYYPSHKDLIKKRVQGKLKDAPICVIENCNRTVYAKERCTRHWRHLRYGFKDITIKKKCSVKGCEKTYFTHNAKCGMCRFHRERKRHGIALNRPKGNKGENNPNWNGGVSDYRNHYLMKKQRKIKFKQVDYKCEKCEDRAKIIHHIDGSKENHALSNLLVLCFSCHGMMHAGRKNGTSKYLRIYNMTLQDIVNKYGGNETSYHMMHRAGTLNQYLKDNTNKQNLTIRGGEKTMLDTFACKVDKETKLAVKLKAIREGKTLKEVIDKLFRAYLKGKIKI